MMESKFNLDAPKKSPLWYIPKERSLIEYNPAKRIFNRCEKIEPINCKEPQIRAPQTYECSQSPLPDRTEEKKTKPTLDEFGQISSKFNYRHKNLDAKCVLPYRVQLYSSVDEVREVLNYILPPLRYTTPDGQVYMQEVATRPATVTDVMELQKVFNERLKRYKANPTGLCSVRRELYDQLFDELIRQVTILCAERGLLLKRIRQELAITLHAYQRVYESALRYGAEKVLLGVDLDYQYANQIEQKQIEISQLQEEVRSWEKRCTEMLVEEDNKLGTLRQHCHDEKNFLQKTHDGLFKQLDLALTFL